MEHGHIPPGDILHGTTTLGTTADGMTHGIMADTGVQVRGMVGILIMPDGTEDGMTLIGDII